MCIINGSFWIRIQVLFETLAAFSMGFTITDITDKVVKTWFNCFIYMHLWLCNLLMAIKDKSKNVAWILDLLMYILVINYDVIYCLPLWYSQKDENKMQKAIIQYHISPLIFMVIFSGSESEKEGSFDDFF